MTAPTDSILLILDLDETLVHASEKPLAREADFQVLGYFVHVRPNLEPFLRECATRFRLAIWSAGADKYVAELVKRIVPPELELDFVWGRSRCTYGLDRAGIWRRSRTWTTSGASKSGTGASSRVRTEFPPRHSPARKE
ncbi:NIF family HAD-type phosphatase [Corallococcus exercitus]|uniref:NIF family HAD-type phosphatase n=1 Tax=Corallococcus exercitus TaxID=2316736 RepID=UPI001C129769